MEVSIFQSAGTPFEGDEPAYLVIIVSTSLSISL